MPQSVAKKKKKKSMHLFLGPQFYFTDIPLSYAAHKNLMKVILKGQDLQLLGVF